MYNIDIRDAMKQHGIYGYQVAEKLGITEFSFSRSLARKEFSEERKKEMLMIISGKASKEAEDNGRKSESEQQ